MANKKIGIVELGELPTQVGTEFIIILQVADDVNNIHSFNCTVQLNGDIHYSSDDTLTWRHICLKTIKVIKILALPHAELRALYKEIGSIPHKFEYRDSETETWVKCNKEPMWDIDEKYRYNPKPRKKYILINGERVPEPIKHKLEVGERYYFADLYALNVGFNYWDNCLDDKRLLELRHIHSTKDNAQKHLDALIKANNQEGVYLDD